MKLKTGHLVLLLAAAYFVILWVTAPTVGYTRDEGYYFKAAEEYAGWWGVLFSSRFFEAFSDAEIRRFFSYNTEHPPLVKLTQGITFHVLSEWLGLAKPAQGFRATGFLFGGLSMIATYLLGRDLVGKGVGVLAALLVATMPRYFYDAHLACFDVPITAMWTFSLWAFHRALIAPPERANRAAIVAGLVFGLGLATKLNVLFLPAVFVFLWWVAPPTPIRFALATGPSGGRDLRLPQVPRVLVACALIGPLVLIAVWPWLWHDTFLRIGQYIGFHLHHEHYPILYLGRLWVEPPFPWSFPVVMTWYTAPSPLVWLGALGFLVGLLRLLFRRSLSDALLLAATFIPIFLIAMPNTPIFGGVKHWYNALPTLSILAARTAFEAVQAFRSTDTQRRPAYALISALMLGPGIMGSIHSHPNGIGYYNELAGGFRGGAELGMQRGFWGGLAYPLYPDFGTRLPPQQTRVFFNRTNYDAYRMYRREGVFPAPISYANEPKQSQVSVIFEQPEHAEKASETWGLFGTRPISGVYQDNVTLVQLYREGASSQPP
ncbi:MAG: glycosyltransferase family 39 protein [Deltaproteobacteria bacterium]|nr:glycosyltransferase family 39 protein [Deltaproteobacteria bacterium]